MRGKAKCLPRVEPLEDRLAPATYIWDGGGTTNGWAEAANWKGDVLPPFNGFNANPATTSEFEFPSGVTKLVSIQDGSPAATVYTLHFSGDGYLLTGNHVAFHTSPVAINNVKGTNTVDLVIQLLGTVEFRAADGTTLNVGGVVYPWIQEAYQSFLRLRAGAGATINLSSVISADNLDIPVQ